MIGIAIVLGYLAVGLLVNVIMARRSGRVFEGWHAVMIGWPFFLAAGLALWEGRQLERLIGRAAGVKKRGS